MKDVFLNLMFNTLKSYMSFITIYHLNKKVEKVATKEEIKTLATKAELKAEQNEIIKFQKNDFTHFIGQSYGAPLYLILRPLYYTLKKLGTTEEVVSWKSKGLFTEKLTTSLFSI